MRDLVGQRIGDYQIESLLGKGSIGVVYRAIDLRIGTHVAIKVLQPDYANDPAWRARFFREAQLAASLEHRNIVQIKHLGEHDGNFYLVMELITGGTLGSLFSHHLEHDSPQALLQKIDLVRQAADGLAAAHAKALVHRDIKPDNLLLSKDDNKTYTLKIADFGIARAENTAATLAGAIVGSPAYMSPEQWRGEAIDSRSDIYSLGVVLYEVSTGCVPFQAESAAAAMHKHLNVEPLPPRQVKPAIPLELEALSLRCLKKAKEERIQTAAELSLALQSIINNLQLAPGPIIPSPVHTVVPNPNRDIMVLDKNLPDLIPPPTPTVKPENKTFPCLLVVDQQGNVLGQSPLMRSLRVGRSADNDLVLPTEEVSPYHARFDWDGNRVAVTDLQSVNGTYLGNQRILPNVSQAHVDDTWWRIGRSWLWVLPKGDTVLDIASVSIELDKEFRELSLVPGQPVTCRLTLINRGSRVDEVSIGIEGFPADWMQGEERVYELMPNKEVRASLTITVPKHSSSTAKLYEVTLRAKSKAHPGDTEVEEARWTILPFHGIHLEIDPIKAAGRTQTRYTVNVINEGNKAAAYLLTAKDDEKSVDFFFTDNKNTEQSRVNVEIAPGEKAALKLKAHAIKYWIGTPKAYSFSVQSATLEGKQMANTEAQFIHRPIFPIWLAVLAPILLVLAVWLAPQWLKPKVKFKPIKTEYLAGESISLQWESAKAKNITLLVDNEVVKYQREGSHSFPAPISSGEKQLSLTLTAEGVFGGRAEDDNLILKIKPPVSLAPVIEYFRIEPESVIAGEPATISWSVSSATSLEISDIGSGLPLKDGKRILPQQTKSYTLVAKNGNATPVTLTQEIRVSPPPTPTPTPAPLSAKIVEFEVVSLEKERPSIDALREGDKVKISWKVTNAKSVKIIGISSTNATKGKDQMEYVIPEECVVKSKSFKLIVIGDDGNPQTQEVAVKADCSKLDRLTKKCRC